LAGLAAGGAVPGAVLTPLALIGSWAAAAPPPRPGAAALLAGMRRRWSRTGRLGSKRRLWQADVGRQRRRLGGAQQARGDLHDRHAGDDRDAQAPGALPSDPPQHASLMGERRLFSPDIIAAASPPDTPVPRHGPLSSATALAAEEREYELVLMIDPGLEDTARDNLAGEVRKQIDSGGNLKHEDDWGMRKLAYEIRQRTEADYRWMRFQASAELLDQLDHNLKIADGVLRFRIFRVDPKAPVIAPPASGAPAAKREAPAS
jgi:small subunit ribosomal protein S6